MDNQLDIGIDWLTVTSHDELDITALVDQVRRTIAAADYGKPFSWRGYVGESYVADEGHLAWGVKLGGGLVQMSGLWADRVFRNLDAFRLLNYKCTRLDLAVTVCLATPAPLVKQAMLAGNLARGDWTAIVKTNGEGGTLYVGCPASDQRGCLYDKGAEIRSKLNKNPIPDCRLWRYEVRYRRSKAQQMRDGLTVLVQNKQALDEAIIRVVHDWYVARGVNPEFQPGETWSSIVQVATRVVNTQKTLDWFRVQVRPAMVRVAQELEPQEILRALGVEIDGGARVRWTRSAVTGIQAGLWDFCIRDL